MAILNGANYDHVDLQAVTGGDTTRHMLQDTAGRAMLAPIEASSTASAAHTPGTDSEFFIYDGKLYQATVSIAQGGTITPNTNCKEAPVGASLSELKSAIANNAISALLHAEEIENTVQSILFDESGNVQYITHARDNMAIRTDEFTFADGTITETRTLNTGESLTIVTNTNTLQTTVTYTAA